MTYDETETLRNLARKLENTILGMIDHPKADALCDIADEIKALPCIFNGHRWIYDQCGFWQHQYCAGCEVAKYPHLAPKRCGELIAEMGKISESEFAAHSNPEAT